MLTEACNADTPSEEESEGDANDVNSVTGLLRQASIEMDDEILLAYQQMEDKMKAKADAREGSLAFNSPRKVRRRPTSADNDLPESPIKMIRTLVRLRVCVAFNSHWSLPAVHNLHITLVSFQSAHTVLLV